MMISFDHGAEENEEEEESVEEVEVHNVHEEHAKMEEPGLLLFWDEAVEI